MVGPLALKAVGRTQISPDEEGLVFSYTDSRITAHPLHLLKYKDLVESLIDQVGKQIQDLLPSGLMLEDLKIQERSLEDNLIISDSIFQQNTAIFDPMIKRVFSGLTDKMEEKHNIVVKAGPFTGRIAKETREAWDKKENALLETILAGVSLSIGIPPRAAQMQELRFESSDKARRNLFICKSELVIGFPTSKSYNRTIREALWALPPGLQTNVLLYFGVIRPVSLNLLARDESRSTHLFPWRSATINAVLQSKTSHKLGMALSFGRLRHLTTAIFRKQLSGMIDPVDFEATSIVNEQADHTQKTANIYGQQTGYLTGLSISDTKIDRFLEVSHTWQALLGIRSAGQQVQEKLQKMPATDLRGENTLIAFDHARIAVARAYGGNQWNGGSRQEARTAISEGQFLPKLQGNEPENRTLLKVIGLLLYGRGGPGLRDSAPVSGYSVETCTEAVTLIWLALKECIDGCDLSLSPVSEETKVYREEIYKKFKEMASINPMGWTKLGLDVWRFCKDDVRIRDNIIL